MEDTQNLSACIAKLQENVLQWEQYLQSEQSRQEAFGQVVDELRASLDDTCLPAAQAGWSGRFPTPGAGL